MNWWQRFLLTRIAKELVRQGPEHRGNMVDYYAILGKAACEEFTEDNKSSLDLFLSECHQESLEKVKLVVDSTFHVVITE